MNKTIQDAYRIVYNDILNNNNDLFIGKYNANINSSDFMAGISTVMEHIAYEVSIIDARDFCSMFTNNMIESQTRGFINGSE